MMRVTVALLIVCVCAAVLPALEPRPALEHVRALGNRLAALQDSDDKARALIEFATEVCKREPAEARRSFLAARDVLVRLRQSGAGPSDRLELTGDLLARRLQPCEAKLAEELAAARADEPPSGPRGDVRELLDSAFDALADPAKSLELAQRALETGGLGLWQASEPERAAVPGAVSRLVWLARQLQEKNEDAGDDLFRAVLAQLRSVPSADPRKLLQLGAYVLPELSGEKRRVDPLLARAYLDVAIELLLRETGSRKAAAQEVAAQLLPQAQALLPQRATQLAGLTAAPEPPPAEEIQLPPPEQPAARSDDGRRRESQIANESDSEARDPDFLFLAADLVRQKNYPRARQVLAKVGSSAAVAALGAVIDLQEGSDWLGRKEVTRAAEIAARMPAGAERAVLRAGIAAARSKTKPLAEEAIASAIRDADAVTDGRQGWLKLAIAQAASLFDPKLALEVFAQAVSGLNRNDPGSEFGVTIRIDRADDPNPRHSARVNLSYAISVPGLTDFGDLRAVTARLAELNPEQTERLCLSLTDPTHLSEALPVLAAAWLANK